MASVGKILTVVNEKERRFGGFKIPALTLFVDQIDRARDKRGRMA